MLPSNKISGMKPHELQVRLGVQKSNGNDDGNDNGLEKVLSMEESTVLDKPCCPQFSSAAVMMFLSQMFQTCFQTWSTTIIKMTQHTK